MSERSRLCYNVMSQQKSLAAGPVLGFCPDRRRLGDVSSSMGVGNSRPQAAPGTLIILGTR